MKKNRSSSASNSQRQVKPVSSVATTRKATTSAPSNSSSSEFDYTFTSKTKAKKSSKAFSSSKDKAPVSSADKGPTKKTIIAIVCSVLAVATIVVVMFFAGVFAPKIDVTMADGTVKTMKVEDVKTALASEVFFDGIVIDGIDVSGMTKAEALQAIANIEPEVPITVDISLALEDEEYPLDFTSLPLQSNKAELVDVAYAYGRPTSQNPSNEELINCFNAVQALNATPMEYHSAYTLSTDGVSSIIHEVLDPLNLAPSDASITGFDIETEQFVIEESKNGYVIDVESAIVDVKAMLDSAVYEGVIQVSAEITPPTVDTEFYTSNFGMISSSSSHTTANNNRNHNIRITCEKIDGLVLQPGESFSFNGFVGQRTAESGYELAGTIQGGTLEEAYGGGICQLSSMLYQSVVKANLQVDERHPHMWPSSYAPAGTDAAVDWGSEDFAFTNTSDYPIAIHATYNNDNLEVTVQIYGLQFENGEYIEFVAEVVSHTPAGETIYVAAPTLPVGQTNQLIPPHDGYSAQSYQVWYDAAGNEISRNEYAMSYYYTIREKIEVGTLNPDGTQAPFDPVTGIVTTPTPPPPPPTETPPTVPVTPPPSDPLVPTTNPGLTGTP